MFLFFRYIALSLRSAHRRDKVDPEATTTKSGLVLGMKEEDTGAGSTTGEVSTKFAEEGGEGGGGLARDPLSPMHVGTGDYSRRSPRYRITPEA